MSEPAAGGADELIAGQYADRRQLRPVLDAVLAALPALGPVTVQPRKTFVSLVTPRRTFAVVQPTTRSRVDLGLRLPDERPGGRLLAARDIGAATVRIPLAGVDRRVLEDAMRPGHRLLARIPLAGAPRGQPALSWSAEPAAGTA